jgi:acyl-CoA dehydrogenase
VAIGERAYQLALSYAKERKQGRALNTKSEGSSAIIEHADIRRMLMLMRAKTDAARAICYMTAAAIDRAHREKDAQKKKQAEERAALLTPVAKSWSTDIGIEVASLGIQIHGGMGFIEASGAAQHLRDARIAAIYEGTNGIQAIDLVTRKITLSDGQAINDLIRDLMDVIDALDESNRAGFGATSDHLSEALGAFERASLFMIDRAKSRPADALASATAYQTLFGITLGGIALVKAALADQGPTADKRIALAKFFAEQIAPESGGLEKIVKDAASALSTIDSVLFA